MDYSTSLISLTGRLHRLLMQTLEGQVSALDITMQEFRIIGLLAGETGISQKALAEKLSVKASTLSVAIDKLEQKKIIVRTSSGDDKRIKLLRIAPEHNLQPAHLILQRLEAQLTAQLTPEALAHTIATLQQLITQLESESRKEI